LTIPFDARILPDIRSPPDERAKEHTVAENASPIPILLLLALPASGKSEVRRYLQHLAPEECRREFGLGPTVQLDDFPYVHLMRRISQEQTARGQQGAFFLSDALPFREPRDWGTLIELLNEDYRDVLGQRRPEPDLAAEWLFDRLDAARRLVGAEPALAALDPGLRGEIAAALESEAADLLRQKNAEVVDDLTGRTILLEFARGGAAGSEYPLPAPYGYRYSLSRLAPEILARAQILYIWVTPEESRRKNEERADPADPGSVLHHGVPLAVMYGDYGCDDMGWLLAQADRPGTVQVERDGRTYHLPVGRFDNRTDRTTFVREDPARWRPQDVAALRAALQEAFAELRKASSG
jgi:hypothetical protein